MPRPDRSDAIDAALLAAVDAHPTDLVPEVARSMALSRAHTQAFLKAFGIDPDKVLTIFQEHGNIGPASVPIVLSKLRELGRLQRGKRIALLGIGSGLNCSMAEVVW